MVETNSWGEEASLVGYGVRLFGKSVGFDLAFLRPIKQEFAEKLVMGIPYLTFSARW